MPIKKINNLLLIILMIVSTNLFAQKKGLFSKKNVLNQYASVGIGGGSSHYYGDLAPYSYFYYGLYTNVRWNGTINYTRTLTSNVSARVSYTYARIYGDDNTYASKNLEKLSANYIRNMHFRNDLQEFVVSGIYNFLPQFGKGAKSRNKIMPYAAVGIGLYGHNPKARGPLTFDNTTGLPIKAKWEALRQYNTSGQGIPGSTVKSYSLVQPVMPIALGIKIKLNEKFDFSAEAGLRLTPFDYLDDVGNTSYPSKSLMVSNYGQDAANLSYRAGEDYSATTGDLRIQNFIQAASQQGFSTAGIAPSTNAEQIYPYSSKRGSKRIDSYVLTQFTISYVLSNSIKCPVIK
ncbi:DUF6089 family protein [Lacihabitans sp. LS3-19]|uniref:DUF6089 family protein n=1 Tax=Lacihabitans sp. LS3-19 TaxID=2487335 RepID=UPI0020CCAD02|nr:DUF6089 family protein [Lacihabitans sp. LS3-19]